MQELDYKKAWHDVRQKYIQVCAQFNTVQREILHYKKKVENTVKNLDQKTFKLEKLLIAELRAKGLTDEQIVEWGKQDGRLALRIVDDANDILGGTVSDTGSD